MEKKRDIMNVVHLIRTLESDDFSKESKLRDIKLYRDNGDITEDEAIDLSIEYCSYMEKGR